jgi:hypothetical protein
MNKKITPPTEEKERIPFGDSDITIGGNSNFLTLGLLPKTAKVLEPMEKIASLDCIVVGNTLVFHVSSAYQLKRSIEDIEIFLNALHDVETVEVLERCE